VPVNSWPVMSIVPRSLFTRHIPTGTTWEMAVRVGRGEASKPSLARQVVELCRRERGHRSYLLRTYDQLPTTGGPGR